MMGASIQTNKTKCRSAAFERHSVIFIGDDQPAVLTVMPFSA